MKPYKKTFLSLKAILLISLLCPAVALPSGKHIALCIDVDGQKNNIAVDDCIVDPIQQRNQKDDHRDDCLDIVMGCEPFDKLIPSLRNNHSLKTKTFLNNLLPSTDFDSLLISHNNYQDPILTYLPLKCGAYSSSKLASISTIVLLI